jgi:hypothetical protein
VVDGAGRTSGLSGSTPQKLSAVRSRHPGVPSDDDQAIGFMLRIPRGFLGETQLGPFMHGAGLQADSPHRRQPLGLVVRSPHGSKRTVRALR